MLRTLPLDPTTQNGLVAHLTLLTVVFQPLIIML
jgi:hypothetical protein